MNSEAICHLVGAGDFEPSFFITGKEDFVIACDGGLRHLESVGVNPHLTVGDFDSLGREAPEGEGVVILPREKDDTDLLYGAKCGLERGYTRFLIHGALGGSRPSHSLGAIALLSFLFDKGAGGCLAGRNTLISMQGRGIWKHRQESGFLSFFAYGGDCILRLEGLKYPFDAHLTPSMTVCVSNEFTGKEATVTVTEGRILRIAEGEGLCPAVYLK